METEALYSLLGLAAFIGLTHTLMGPDHYVPFIAMAKAGRWTTRRTLAITTLCGVGHVLGSVVLGLLGVALGWALGGIEAFEGMRGSLAGWLLIGFGFAYTLWGIRAAIKNKPHAHVHAHSDGTLHNHQHTHHQEHAHVHKAPAPPKPAEAIEDEKARVRVMTPWLLFLLFVFGPCEALIPELMYPAAAGDWGGVLAVTGVFALVTIGTMLAVVMLATMGLRAVKLPSLERYTHLTAGLALLMCGLAIQMGL